MTWNPNDVLRIVDSLHRDKNIDKEFVFQAIESALVSAARKHYGEESDVVITIERATGGLEGTCDGERIDPEVIGRIGAQTAKQVIIQKIREAERDSLVEEYDEQVGQMVTGVVQRNEGGATTVSLGAVEAILPRSEQIPGESHHPNERVRAIIYEVKSQGNRVKVVLSRNHPNLVARLFEQEIPEIADGVIALNALAREPGYRSKVAVSSSDQRIDCVGACVGVRGNRIKNIVDELAGERIDIVRWNEDPEVLIPNALQPAEVDQVLLCDMIGRAIVLVGEDQLSLAIGRRGQNVRLASKLCGWDIEIMTAEELDDQIERAVMGFGELEGMTEDLAQSLVEQGYLSYDDLEMIEPDALQEMGGLTEAQVDLIVSQAEERARQAEEAAAEARRRQKEQEALQQAQAEAQAATQVAAEASPDPTDTTPPEQPAETDATDTTPPERPAETEAAADPSSSGDEDGSTSAPAASEATTEMPSERAAGADEEGAAADSSGMTEGNGADSVADRQDERTLNGEVTGDG